eukprot:987729-Prymnesium_polylepis.1
MSALPRPRRPGLSAALASHRAGAPSLPACAAAGTVEGGLKRGVRMARREERGKAAATPSP